MARFVSNRGFKSEIQATPEFQKGEAQITVRVAESIKAAAEPFRNTGHFIGEVKARKTRVYLERHFAHLSEYGSIHNLPQGNARRGVNSLGMRFQDDGPKQAD